MTSLKIAVKTLADQQCYNPANYIKGTVLWCLSGRIGSMPLCHLCCCGRVLFRVHESVNIVSDFMFKVGGNSVSRGMGEIIPSQKLCNVWPISYK